MGSSSIEKKIYYHDTDCGGVVYYANYLKYLEEGRSEFFLENGVSLKDLSEQGIYFVVAHTELDYKSPARYQETIEVSTAVKRIGRCSLDFSQDIARQGACLVQAKTTLVCVSKGFKPIPLPEGVRKKLSNGD